MIIVAIFIRCEQVRVFTQRVEEMGSQIFKLSKRQLHGAMMRVIVDLTYGMDFLSKELNHYNVTYIPKIK